MFECCCGFFPSTLIKSNTFYHILKNVNKKQANCSNFPFFFLSRCLSQPLLKAHAQNTGVWVQFKIYKLMSITLIRIEIKKKRFIKVHFPRNAQLHFSCCSLPQRNGIYFILFVWMLHLASYVPASACK